MNCPNCEIKASNKNFNTWNNVIYSDCKNCGCSFQNPIIKFDYNEDHWETAIDPDGVKRNFITERDFRVKNWFGNAINFVNNLKPGKILDVGCGLGCFFCPQRHSAIHSGPSRAFAMILRRFSRQSDTLLRWLGA